MHSAPEVKAYLKYLCCWQRHGHEETTGPSGEEIEALHPFHKAYREIIGIEGLPEKNMWKAKATYYGLVELLDGWIGRILDLESVRS